MNLVEVNLLKDIVVIFIVVKSENMIKRSFTKIICTMKSENKSMRYFKKKINAIFSVNSYV